MPFLLNDITPSASNRVFAIGDIHGCFDEFDVLISFLETDAGLSSEDTIIFIGDYIDRGINSKAVIEKLLCIQQKYPMSHFLRGNHEDMLLSYLGFEGHNGVGYLANGGRSTLRSYGFPNLPGSSQEVLDWLPREHVEFFLHLESAIKISSFLFVHAGISPEKKLEEQDEKTLFWIREDFIFQPHDLGMTIVFGHTPFEEIYFDLPYRIGIDTGLVYGNFLTGIELTTKSIYQVHIEKKEVRVSNW